MAGPPYIENESLSTVAHDCMPDPSGEFVNTNSNVRNGRRQGGTLLAPEPKIFKPRIRKGGGSKPPVSPLLDLLLLTRHPLQRVMSIEEYYTSIFLNAFARLRRSLNRRDSSPPSQQQYMWWPSSKYLEGGNNHPMSVEDSFTHFHMMTVKFNYVLKNTPSYYGRCADLSKVMFQHPQIVRRQTTLDRRARAPSHWHLPAPWEHRKSLKRYGETRSFIVHFQQNNLKSCLGRPNRHKSLKHHSTMIYAVVLQKILYQ